jgi:hypothetical protein
MAAGEDPNDMLAGGLPSPYPTAGSPFPLMSQPSGNSSAPPLSLLSLPPPGPPRTKQSTMVWRALDGCSLVNTVHSEICGAGRSPSHGCWVGKNRCDGSLLAYPTRPLQLHGLPHRRCGAASARLMGTRWKVPDLTLWAMPHGIWRVAVGLSPAMSNGSGLELDELPSPAVRSPKQAPPRAARRPVRRPRRASLTHGVQSGRRACPLCSLGMPMTIRQPLGLPQRRCSARSAWNPR